MVATTITADTSKPNSSITWTTFTNNTAGPANLTASWDPALTECPHGGGGALCIHAQLLGVVIINNTFEGNSARFGGLLPFLLLLLLLFCSSVVTHDFCCCCYRRNLWLVSRK
jgi:hypothetical protein